jgi:predicted aspartyl protease
MSDRMHCFTLKHTGRARVLHTPVTLALPSLDFTSPKFQTRCIWDTGASGTVITQNVIDALGLKPTGQTTINTASERNKISDTYEVDIFLSDSLVFQTITVTLGVIIEGIDCLLGMDIIGTGDLSVTNYNGNTCMSFRHPSMHEIDFAKEKTLGLSKAQAKKFAEPAKNAPCYCGSGKIYKRCHGKGK